MWTGLRAASVRTASLQTRYGERREEVEVVVYRGLDRGDSDGGEAQQKGSDGRSFDVHAFLIGLQSSTHFWRIQARKCGK